MTAHRRAFGFPERQRIVEIDGSCGEPCATLGLTWLAIAYRTSSAGNRQRPPYGGHYARRTHGASTRHQSPARRPACQGNFLSAGPYRGLVLQMVAALLGSRTGRPLRSDPGQSPRCPTPLARTGTDDRFHPPTAASPCHT